MICGTHQRERLESPAFCRQRVGDIGSVGKFKLKMNLTVAFPALAIFLKKLKLVKSTNTDKTYNAEFYHYGESYRFYMADMGYLVLRFMTK